MAFKIGDVVMRMDGDKRPHKIVDIAVHYPLNSREHTFFQYHYEDGGSDISGRRFILTEKDIEDFKDYMKGE